MASPFVPCDYESAQTAARTKERKHPNLRHHQGRLSCYCQDDHKVLFFFWIRFLFSFFPPLNAPPSIRGTLDDKAFFCFHWCSEGREELTVYQLSAFIKVICSKAIGIHPLTPTEKNKYQVTEQFVKFILTSPYKKSHSYLDEVENSSPSPPSFPSSLTSFKETTRRQDPQLYASYRVH